MNSFSMETKPLSEMRTVNKFDIALLILRIVLGIVIFAHGAQKLLGWFGGYGFEGTMIFFTQTIGLPYVLGFLIIIEESLGMLALIFGFLSRIVSSALIIVMTGAFITTHWPHGFFMNWFGNQAGEGFEYDLLVFAMAATIAICGAGIYSLDTVLLKKWRR